MPFVAFPHQVNDLEKLGTMLGVVSELIDDGQDVGTDDVIGYELFLRGIIESRDYSSQSLADQLEEIKRKPRSDQSPLTIARDIRRLFLFFGFLKLTVGRYSITDRGRKIINGSTSSSQSVISIDAKKAWLEGLESLMLSQENSSRQFHPLRVMLEMLSDRPRIESKLLTFVFTARNDSATEIQRIRDIVARITTGRSDFETELGSNGISESNARNSVKIIPALAEQLGLIQRTMGFAEITPFGRTVLDKYNLRQGDLHPPSSPSGTRPRTPTAQSERAGTERREPFFRIITSDNELVRNWSPIDVEQDEVEYDPRDETERLSRLRERTDLHQQTLIKLRRAFEGKGWRIGIGNFDLLTTKNDVALLHEVKTILQGDESDERLRIIDAVGKLFFYERFDAPSLVSATTRIQKILVFSRKPTSNEHIRFLKDIGVWVIWFDDAGNLDGEEVSKTELLRLLA